MDNSESFHITLHALERFRERWEVLKGEPLEEADVLPKLRSLIVAAKEETESDAIQKRRSNYNSKEEGCYTFKEPWRFVWIGSQLITVELNRGSFRRPRLYGKQIRAKFFLRVTENPEGILIEKSVRRDFPFVTCLLLLNKPEVNAVIGFLRLLGIDVGYTRIGTETIRKAILTICLPEALRQFEIKEYQKRKLWLLFPGKENPFLIFGITPEDCKDIFNFIDDKEWVENIPLILECLSEEQKQKLELKRKRREIRQENRRKKREKYERREKDKLVQEKSPAVQKRDRIVEILGSSHDSAIVWYKLRMAFRKQIQIEEGKLGKTWLLRYYFTTTGIHISAVVKDVRTLQEGRIEIIPQIISQLQSFVNKSTV